MTGTSHVGDLGSPAQAAGDRSELHRVSRRASRWPSRACLASISCIPAVLAACARPQDDGRKEPSPQTVEWSSPTSTDREHAGQLIHVPTFSELYGLSDTEIRRLNDLWQAAVATCMAARGFPNYQAVALPDEIFDDEPFEQRTRSELQSTGLRSAAPGGPAPTDPNERSLQDPGFLTALGGDDAGRGGCAQVTVETVYGRGDLISPAVGALTDLDSAVLSRLESDDEYRSLDRDWSVCMGRAGYSYERRFDLKEVSFPGPEVGADEIRTALADFDCRAAVGYPARYQHVFTRVQNDVLDTNAQRLAELDRQLDHQVRLALGGRFAD